MLMLSIKCLVCMCCHLPGVSGGVALVPTAATDAADAGAKEEEDDSSEDDPDPDTRATFTIQSSQTLVLVTIPDKGGALVFSQTLSAPETVNEAVELLLSIVQYSVVLQQVSATSCSRKDHCCHAEKVNQQKNRQISRKTHFPFYSQNKTLGCFPRYRRYFGLGLPC